MMDNTNYLCRLLYMIFIIIKEIMNICTVLYCICVSLLTVYSIITESHKEYFDILRSITLYSLCITLFRYIFEFYDYVTHFTEKLIDCESSVNINFYRKIKRERNQSLIHIIQNITAILFFLHSPPEDSIEFCMIKYTQIHMLEISTIIISIIVHNTIFINDMRQYYVLLKFISIVLCLSIQICWILPSIIYDIFKHDIGKDLWHTNASALLFVFWLIHIKLGYILVKKLETSIYKGNLSCNRRKMNTH
jgi:hypothetical protein